METREQLEILKESSCDYIQGYYFSKPMPADDLPCISTPMLPVP